MYMYIFKKDCRIEIEKLDGQSAQHAIVKAKQRSQRPVIGWVTKIYYLALLCASDSTLSR
jgi:hypothetical protein